MNPDVRLTKQERRILELVTKGRRNSHIAAELFISTKTVETHLHRIFTKMGVSSRTEAAIHFLSTADRYPKVHESTDDRVMRKD